MTAWVSDIAASSGEAGGAAVAWDNVRQAVGSLFLQTCLGAPVCAPTQPVLDSTSSTGYWDWNTTNASPSNPVASLALATDEGTTWRSVGNIQASYRPRFVEGLTANINLGYDLTKADRRVFFPNNLAAQVRQGQGFLSLQNNSQGSSVLETYLGYNPQRSFGPGILELVGGYSYQLSHAEYPEVRETGLTSNVLGDNGILPAVNVTNTKSLTDFKLISFFGRANYNISDRYIASLSIRRDNYAHARRRMVANGSDAQRCLRGASGPLATEADTCRRALERARAHGSGG